jgi:uncharacterized membrane protein
MGALSTTAPQAPLAAPASSRRWRRDIAVVGVPTLLAALLCLYQLGTRSLWLDEGATFAITSAHGRQLWAGIAHDGGNMALYYLLEHVLIGAFGDAKVVLRMPSVLAQAVTAGLTAVLALRLRLGRLAALIAGLLVAVSLPLTYWGQNARGYAMMTALSVASFVALHVLLEGGRPAGRPQAEGRRGRHVSTGGWGAPLAYTLCTLAALYVGIDAILLIPAQLLLAAWLAPRRLRTLIGCLIVAAVASVPLAVLALERGSGQLFWVPRLGFRTLNVGAQALSSAAQSSLRSPTSAATEIVGLLLAAVAVGVLIRRRHRSGAGWNWLHPFGGDATGAGIDGSETSGDDAAGQPADRDRGAWFSAIWLLLPVLLILLVSAVGEPIELDRIAVLLIPALALLTAWLLLSVGIPRRAAWAAVVVLLALRAVPLVSAYGQTGEPWGTAVAQVAAQSRAGERACVAFFPQDGRNVFDYYMLRNRLTPGNGVTTVNLRPVWPALPFTTIKPYVERYALPSRQQLNTIIAGCPTLWLIASHVGDAQGPPLSEFHVLGYERLITALNTQYPHALMTLFGRPSQLTLWKFSH